jgi:hypothetical protein
MEHREEPRRGESGEGSRVKIDVVVGSGMASSDRDTGEAMSWKCGLVPLSIERFLSKLWTVKYDLGEGNER